MEIIKNIKWTWAVHSIHRPDNRWSTALTVWTAMVAKEIEEVNEKVER